MRIPGRGRSEKGTTVFFATDVHGSERTWRKFLNAAAFYQADVLVMGGDVMGKLVIPVIRGADGRHRATIHGRVEHLETDADVARAVECAAEDADGWRSMPVAERFEVLGQVAIRLALSPGAEVHLIDAHRTVVRVPLAAALHPR